MCSGALGSEAVSRFQGGVLSRLYSDGCSPASSQENSINPERKQWSAPEHQLLQDSLPPTANEQTVRGKHHREEFWINCGWLLLPISHSHRSAKWIHRNRARVQISLVDWNASHPQHPISEEACLLLLEKPPLRSGSASIIHNAKLGALPASGRENAEG